MRKSSDRRMADEAVEPLADRSSERSVTVTGGILEGVTWPNGCRPACPVCTQPTTGLGESNAWVGRERVVVAIAQPCGCVVNDQAAALQAGAT